MSNLTLRGTSVLSSELIQKKSLSIDFKLNLKKRGKILLKGFTVKYSKSTVKNHISLPDWSTWCPKIGKAKDLKANPINIV